MNSTLIISHKVLRFANGALVGFSGRQHTGEINFLYVGDASI